MQPGTAAAPRPDQDWAGRGAAVILVEHEIAGVELTSVEQNSVSWLERRAIDTNDRPPSAGRRGAIICVITNQGIDKIVRGRQRRSQREGGEYDRAERGKESPSRIPGSMGGRSGKIVWHEGEVDAGALALKRFPSSPGAKRCKSD